MKFGNMHLNQSRLLQPGAAPKQNCTMNWSGTIPANGKNVRVIYRADTSSIGSITINSDTKSTVAGVYTTYHS